MCLHGHRDTCMCSSSPPQSQPEVSSGSDRRMLSDALNAIIDGSPQSRKVGRPHSRPQSPIALPRNYSPVGAHRSSGGRRQGGGRWPAGPLMPSLSSGSQGKWMLNTLDSEMEVAQALFDLKAGS